jgi:glyoxylase-like metal-dependent hydrolase (beta-lactamase superfamily II)
MAEDTQAWQVGEARLTAVVEAQTDHIPPAFFFPSLTEERVRSVPWLVPDYADEAGNIAMTVQAVVVEVGGRTVVVDPCVGNDRTRESPFWHQQHWPFLDRFRAAGFDPAAVDLVVHTHLHTDHVGWGTQRVDGRWVPTFPNARYAYARPELDWLAARAAAATGPDGTATGEDADAFHIHADAVAPVLAAGLADVVDLDADLGDGLVLTTAPGHSPGHAVLWLTSGGERAVLAGDAIHHPVQCDDPVLAFVSDDDPALALATRRALLDEVAATGALLLPAHFPSRPAGRLVAAGDAPGDGGGRWRFAPEGTVRTVPA